MLSLLAATLMATGQEPVARMMQLLEPDKKPPRLSLYIRESPLDPPKFSPKLFGDPAQRWQFDWISSSFGPDANSPRDPSTGEQQGKLRFRVFSQIKKKGEFDYTVHIARQAIRMWDVLYNKYRIQHNESVNLGIVDYYICWGGQAGGEYVRGEDLLPDNRTVTVSTIYIYDIQSFVKPIEMAREVAHEYGHAVLPAVGGYKEPEYWANGYLGEKMLMRILRDQYAKGIIVGDDVMGATLDQLNWWVKTYVDPLVVRAASNPPSVAQLKDRGKPGVDAYAGLVLYADTIFPARILTRSMLLMGSQNAEDYPEALLLATQEVPKITLNIPAYLKGKPLWIPLGKGKVAQAQILARSGDWAKIQPQAGAVVVTTAK
jgi:hypothetical protein